MLDYRTVRRRSEVENFTAPVNDAPKTGAGAFIAYAALAMNYVLIILIIAALIKYLRK